MNEQMLSRCLIGSSSSMRSLRSKIVRVAPTTLPVLIQGPTGSGKELVARAIHDLSGRRGSFVAFNVCAIADSMFEDALFGHVRGAFTSASGDMAGYLAEADRGTIFLDEISSLSLSAQAKLLRAIETREFRPVGGRMDRRSDFRVVVATNESVETLVDQQRFRSDLSYRLRGLVLEVPSLRERLSDVSELAEYFVKMLGDGVERRLSACAVNALSTHHWPGNVRELRQAVESALAMSDGEVITAADFPATLERSGSVSESRSSFARRRLLTVLEQFDWDTLSASAHLGVARSTLYRRMQRLGLKAPVQAGLAQHAPHQDRTASAC